jgi:hypothetical protein
MNIGTWKGKLDTPPDTIRIEKRRKTPASNNIYKVSKIVRINLNSLNVSL